MRNTLECDGRRVGPLLRVEVRTRAVELLSPIFVEAVIQNSYA